jgi:RimJ/RimL family protein N-acetyltransferase
MDPEWQVLQQSAVRPRPDGPAQELFRRWSANESASAVGFSVDSRESGEFVGHVTLQGGALPARAATLGVVIGPTHVGRGYGTDAVRVIARYGFRALGLHRIGVEVLAFNTRGRRAAEKAGFVLEGTRRESVFVDGGWTDELLLGQLRPDWEAAEEARRLVEAAV